MHAMWHVSGAMCLFPVAFNAESPSPSWGEGLGALPASPASGSHSPALHSRDLGRLHFLGEAQAPSMSLGSDITSDPSTLQPPAPPWPVALPFTSD